MTNDRAQMELKSNVPRVEAATPEELEQAAKSLAQHACIRIDEKLDQITHVISRYGDKEFFDAYKLAAERKSSDEIAKSLALVLTDGFAISGISPRHFDVEELERIIVNMHYMDMAK